MVIPRVLPMGEHAVLFEVDSLEEVMGLHAQLAASRPDGVLDLVPAARTVLVPFDAHVVSAAAVRAWGLAATAGAAPVRESGPAVVLDIAYDGEDLADSAALLGLSVDELVHRHSGADWTVAFTGFAPGFGYLVSDDWAFDVPRLASPRTRVPAGAVGLAGSFTGAYPRDTPGGWRLIGTTPAPLFDPDAAAPALLAPGTRVRFRAVDARAAAGGGAVEESPAAARSSGIRVVAPGPLATVQDLGRPGSGSLGVSRSGAADRTALRTANRLVGNDEHAAAIEITMGGFAAIADVDVWCAITGGWGRVVLDGHDVDPYAAHLWREGAELRIEPFAHGARAYLAVRGGVGGGSVLGSRSTDLLSGLGPARIAAGVHLPVDDGARVPIPAADVAPWGPPRDDELELDVTPGPRADWFAASARTLLFDATWTVSDAADRVGVRLDGPELVRVRSGELPSEGMVPGALQVPPNGRPVVLGPDAPATGGYPVIAVMTDAALDLLAQARPGTRLRLRHARERH